jgi:hypothetical protein
MGTGAIIVYSRMQKSAALQVMSQTITSTQAIYSPMRLFVSSPFKRISKNIKGMKTSGNSIAPPALLPISRRGTLFRYRIEWKSAISIEKLYR